VGSRVAMAARDIGMRSIEEDWQDMSTPGSLYTKTLDLKSEEERSKCR
jgi:hypothetical protein